MDTTRDTAPGKDPAAPTAADDQETLRALRAGDEAAFARLIDRYNASLVRVAMLYVRTRDVAEEVVQDTWIGVIQGLARFEGRSSLKTWIFRILMNRAMTRGERERRSIPFSALGDRDDASEGLVGPDRFRGPNDDWPGHWARAPHSWDEIPEERLLSNETLSLVSAAIEALPPHQREVMTLRDLEGWSSAEVCDSLDITDVNQRVLLHRARAKVRRALERYFDDEGVSARHS